MARAYRYVVTRWPHSLELLNSQMDGVPPEEHYRMVAAGNVVKFFHLE